MRQEAPAPSRVTGRGIAVDGHHPERLVEIGLLSGAGTLNIENGGEGCQPKTACTAGSSLGIRHAQHQWRRHAGDPLLRRAGRRGSQANFDNGILQARANNATFIIGFSGAELNLLAGGLTIDTAAASPWAPTRHPGSPAPAA